MRYGVLISNTNRSDKAGMHWWSILDFIQEVFPFDSFGISDLENFI